MAQQFKKRRSKCEKFIDSPNAGKSSYVPYKSEKLKSDISEGNGCSFLEDWHGACTQPL